MQRLATLRDRALLSEPFPPHVILYDRDTCTQDLHGRDQMNEPIGIGILGAGWITRAHGHALHTIGHMAPLARPIRLVALSARRAEQGEALADELGVDRFTTDWAKVVNDPNVQVVANLQGTSAHREATEAALALGKPVLCEKPLGADRFEAGHMAAAAALAGVPAVCGFSSATCLRCGLLGRSFSGATSATWSISARCTSRTTRRCGQLCDRRPALGQ
jgi:hypothetical protein